MKKGGKTIVMLDVATKYGAVRGVESAGGYALFKGVPYAKAPVGELRWKPSVAPEKWDGVRDCSAWGKACIQDIGFTDKEDAYGKEFYAGADYPPDMGEDCLYLNIWTPAKSAEDKLPVMMWMHGGGVQHGYSHEVEFDGDALCDRGVILVSVNYRLNIFGYFAHPELSAENEHHASGNYGVHDQVQALRWIHENIAFFGGDPENVTIFGQSGGGRSAQALSCSPLTKGLMKRAIVQSAGGLKTSMGRMPREMLEMRGVEFMEFAGCKNIAELRALDANTLHEYYRQFAMGGDSSVPLGKRRNFNIAADGHALPLTMEDTVIAGKQHDIDYMIGCVTGDCKGPMFESQAGWAQLQCKQGKKPVYFYRFERELPENEPKSPKTLKGAFHSSELWYMFGTLDRCWRPMTQEDQKLSVTMLDMWTNFAKTGDPNGAELPVWEKYDDAAPQYMRFDIGSCGMEDADADGTLQAKIDALLI